MNYCNTFISKVKNILNRHLLLKKGERILVCVSGGVDSVVLLYVLNSLKSDLIKIITSLGIGEVVYTIVRWSLQYYLLQIEYDAYLASIISQMISTVVYMIVLNLSVKMSRLYKDDT